METVVLLLWVKKEKIILSLFFQICLVYNHTKVIALILTGCNFKMIEII